MATRKETLFEEVCSEDFLKFKFGGRGYQDQLNDSIAKTEVLAGVKVELLQIPGTSTDIVWVTHNFGFLGGSLGCAEGEKIARAFEYGLEHNLPVCVQCRSGGARMQEGTSSLMQMAKVSVAVQALQSRGLPFISVLSDPTYGGVSASYAMQADVKIATSDARIGFAGPQVILNTMCEANQTQFDQKCPVDFQASNFVYENGQVDLVLDTGGLGADAVLAKIQGTVGRVASFLMANQADSFNMIDCLSQIDTAAGGSSAAAGSAPKRGRTASSDLAADEVDTDAPAGAATYNFNYTRSRAMDRPQTQDIIGSLFNDFTELSGDGRVGRDVCLKGGLAAFGGISCVVIATFKGHTPTDMQNANYGMPSPHGYRTALRLMKLAEKFKLPVVTLVDTVGAWPTFECEKLGQSEAIATNLTEMAGLKTPIITLMVGEGGSGGALGICMGNVVGMLSGGYFGVISPEGAASILGRYNDAAHKAEQFPLDCQALATAQCIYAHQLKEMGVVDAIIWEADVDASAEKETYTNFPVLKSRISAFVVKSLMALSDMTGDELVQQRFDKYRALGQFATLDETGRKSAIESAKEASTAGKKPRAAAVKPSCSALIKHMAEELVSGPHSQYRGLAPANVTSPDAIAIVFKNALEASQKIADIASKAAVTHVLGSKSAKAVLDALGPKAMADWVVEQSKTRLLVTDTTMRDAHQSLLATRVRTIDIVNGAKIASNLLADAFSLECWGGATFDVSMRFLDECPWERLREMRKACPNVCFQMLIRGSNAVGYTSYPDNAVTEFVRLAAQNGMDVFRVFDCFNIVDSMRVAIDAVIANNKVAEVCMCYTGNLLTSPIYDVDYYRALATEIKATGAHILAIKDMAGLLKPMEAAPLMKAVREAIGEDMPVHFHTHSTSSGSLATCMEMARCGCNIIDTCTASMADGTSQPSMNAFVAMMEGAPNDTGIKFMDLEAYDMYWGAIRNTYSPFESGMKSGTARVFEHQIPGGQYSNLLVQSKSLNLDTPEKWSAVLDAYRDVNQLFGDVVKVTPSSKCVGDMALYLVNKGLTCQQIMDPSFTGTIDFPESVVGLMKGDLGFPHRGFPKAVEDMVLRGAAKRTIRAGLQLTPVDFAKNLADVQAAWPDFPISECDAMSSIMYPKVFSDYMTKKAKAGRLLTYLPSTVYNYGLLPGEAFTMTIPNALAKDLLTKEVVVTADRDSSDVRVELVRVSALHKGTRTVTYKITQLASGTEETQSTEVKDSGGVFVFAGPMADATKESHIGSPMPGVVEKLLVKKGDTVAAGDILCIISAMKMEVKVTAPRAGVISVLHIPATGYRVVEGALLAILK